MLVSFWWVVAAFVLGGTGGALALAVFSAGSGGRDDDVAFSQLSQTR